MDTAISQWKQAESLRRGQQWREADQLFSTLASCDPSPVAQVACGAYFAERQDHHAALVHLATGLDGALASGNLKLQAVIYGNLASIYRELGETDLARRFQRQVLSLQDAADAGDLLNWSADALLAGNLHLAESLAQNAWELAEDSAEISLKADLCGMLGVIAARRGELRRAVFLLIRAARGHQIDGDDHGLGVDFQNLAEVFGRMERFLWQRLSFEAAQTCFARAGRPLSTATAQRRLRDCDRLFLYRGMHPESN